MGKKTETIILNQEQMDRIMHEWNSRPTSPPSIGELVLAAFGVGVDPDGRFPHAKAVKTFIASRQLVARVTSTYVPKAPIELSIEQKETIDKNASGMDIHELTQLIFQNPALNNLSQEYRTIEIYLRKNGTKALGQIDEIGEYRPAKQIDRMIFKINKYNFNTNYSMEKLNPRIKKETEALIKYMNDYRFIHQITTYKTETDRDLFESSFIKFTFDKPDLTKEDLDQYIILCTEVVISSRIQKTINELQAEQDRVIMETGKITMTLVELIGQTRNEYNSSVERQQKLFKSLNTERSKRLADQINQNATILNIIQSWQDEEERTKMIKYAEKRKEILSEAIDEITDWEESKAKWFGLNKPELLNG